MKQLMKVFVSKYILAGLTVLLAFTVSCTSETKKEGEVTTVGTDSNANNNMTVTTPSADMTTTTPGDSASMTATGNVAKPNPAKKGAKGKVSVTEQKGNSSSAMSMDNTGVYSSAEIMPAYPGGYNKMSDYFSSNVEYPQDATDNGIEGTVEVNFAVDEAGKLSNAKVISPRIGYGLEEEALRVVNKMPTWTPGRIKGKNVKTYYTLPVRFQLY